MSMARGVGNEKRLLYVMKLWFVTAKEDQFRNLGVDRRIILKCTLENYVVRNWSCCE
jgi:hypothetical protein